MSPTIKTIIKYLVLVTAVVATLGPSVAQLNGLLPPSYITLAIHVIAAAASIHLFLIQSPLVQPLLATPKQPPRLPPLLAMYWTIWALGIACAGLSIQACASSSALAAWAADVKSGTAAVVPAENLVCAVATEVDPTGATAICAEVDTAGNIVSTGLTVLEDVAAITALVSKHPASATMAAKLHAADMALATVRKASVHK